MWKNIQCRAEKTGVYHQRENYYRATTGKTYLPIALDEEIPAKVAVGD
jgi:hypothetical protein